MEGVGARGAYRGGMGEGGVRGARGGKGRGREGAR